VFSVYFASPALFRDEELEPIPSRIADEIAGHPTGYVPHHLPESNPYLHEFADRMTLPMRPRAAGREPCILNIRSD
jgi:hypothetical protein